MYKIAVFVSGRGSNFRTVYNSIDGSKAQICAIVSDVNNCGAVQFANEKNIPVFIVKSKLNPNGFSFVNLADELKKSEIDLIVLAGFLKKVADEFVEAFENKIINTFLYLQIQLNIQTFLMSLKMAKLVLKQNKNLHSKLLHTLHFTIH